MGHAMNFEEAIKSGFTGYFKFEGRACRSEFWFWNLFVFLGIVVAATLDGFMGVGGLDGTGPIEGFFSLATFIPGISVTVRRLHDVERSGWWYWLIFVIIIGWIVLLYWLVTKGTDGANEYGEDPLGDDGAAVADVFE